MMKRDLLGAFCSTKEGYYPSLQKQPSFFIQSSQSGSEEERLFFAGYYILPITGLLPSTRINAFKTINKQFHSKTYLTNPNFMASSAVKRLPVKQSSLARLRKYIQEFRSLHLQIVPQFAHKMVQNLTIILLQIN